MATCKNAPNMFKMEASEKKHICTDYLARIYPENIYNHREPIKNNITCKPTGKFLGYRDQVKMDASVWTNLMCNDLGRLYQGWKQIIGTDTIYFIFHKYIQEDIRATSVGAVLNIRAHKADNHVTCLTVGGNLINYTIEVIPPISDLDTMKLHINSSVLSVKSRYI